MSLLRKKEVWAWWKAPALFVCLFHLDYPLWMPKILLCTCCDALYIGVMPFSLDGFGSSMYETINSTILFTPQTTDMCKMVIPLSDVNDQLGLGDSRYHFIRHILPILVQGKIPLHFNSLLQINPFIMKLFSRELHLKWNWHKHIQIFNVSKHLLTYFYNSLEYYVEKNSAYFI